jgi:hypothetical protein
MLCKKSTKTNKSPFDCQTGNHSRRLWHSCIFSVVGRVVGFGFVGFAAVVRGM